jgi:flagellar biosynthesis anti-sigma factor FlgM
MNIKNNNVENYKNFDKPPVSKTKPTQQEHEKKLSALSSNVQVSHNTHLLQHLDDNSIDQEQVERNKKAIADSTFKINAEKIAEKMIQMELQMQNTVKNNHVE